jgi:hypothetical protein
MARARLKTVLCAAVLLLCSARLDAAWITIGWDANAEPDVAGYIVAYGTAPGRDDVMVNVGTVTNWTFGTATTGVRYYFRVYAYNSAGLRSPASSEVVAQVSSSDRNGPLSLDKQALNFGAVRAGIRVSTIYSGTQEVVVTSNTGAATPWTVSSSVPWLTIAPRSGAGTGTFTVTMNPTALPLTTGNYSGAITVDGGGTTLALPVGLELKSVGSTRAPLGAFDTPIDGTTGVQGAIPVTGWALDDIQVSKVQIYRDPVPGESGLIYLGDATFVAGARPDVEAGFGTWPMNYRAGWGFMLLTNMLPDVPAGTPTGGNGTFRLHAIAVDVDGNSVDLGTKTIVVSNTGATLPFGTIDTPAQGGVVSGTAYINFGWAISPTARIPDNGSTITVLIDGVPVGQPNYGHYRADIAGAFPRYSNTNGAIGYFVLDTTKLSNGMHTIAWVASDDQGHSSGLGSRFFTVLNDTSSTAAMTAATPMGAETAPAEESGAPVEIMAELPVENAAVTLARPASGEAVPETVVPDFAGAIEVRSVEAEPIDLQLETQFQDGAGGTYAGYLVSGGEMRPLPLGSTLDPNQGRFRWQPGAGFIGTYELVFVKTRPDGSKSRVPVTFVIRPPFEAGTR